MSKPKDCPFCAGTDTAVDVFGALYAVACDDCGAVGPCAGSSALAVALWDGAVTDRVETREEAAQRMRRGGSSRAAIAAALGVHERTVTRYLARTVTGGRPTAPALDLPVRCGTLYDAYSTGLPPYAL